MSTLSMNFEFFIDVKDSVLEEALTGVLYNEVKSKYPHAELSGGTVIDRMEDSVWVASTTCQDTGTTYNIVAQFTFYNAFLNITSIKEINNPKYIPKFDFEVLDFFVT